MKGHLAALLAGLGVPWGTTLVAQSRRGFARLGALDAPQPGQTPWYVYLVRAADQSLYCGSTTDVAKRVAKHNTGCGAKALRGRLPVTLVLQSRAFTMSAALRLEAAIKKQPADKKVLLLARYG